MRKVVKISYIAAMAGHRGGGVNEMGRQGLNKWNKEFSGTNFVGWESGFVDD